MLLEALAEPDQFEGCLVDGFPRTVIQVQLLKLLQDKMGALSRSVEVDAEMAAGARRRSSQPTPHDTETRNSGSTEHPGAPKL